MYVGKLGLLLLAVTVCASKDGQFYPGTNKLVNEKMYWANSDNVLEDLAQFDALYVTFHNCAMSTYATGSDNPCDFPDVSGEYWYMKEGECIRANAAYSLYGILQGEENQGCTQATFVNSFHTSAGVETFTAAMTKSGFTFSNNGDQITSDCENSGDGNQDQDNNDNGGQYSHNGNLYSGSSSYGLACTNENFRKKTFSGSFCHQRKVTAVDDSLTSFNEELAQARCMQIYSSSDRNDDNEEGNGENDPLQLLSYSSACQLSQYGDACPDPYGKLRHYESLIQSSTISPILQRRARIRRIISWILMILGLLLVTATLVAEVRSTKKDPERLVRVNGNSAQKFFRAKEREISDEFEGAVLAKKKRNFFQKLRRK